MAAYLAAADVFVMPCRDDRHGLQTEGLGLAVLEASASGAPVVVGRSGGSVDSVIDGVTGTLVRGDAPFPHALAAAIRGLVEQPDRRRRLAAEARAEVGRRFGWPAVLAEYRRVLGIDPPPA